MNLYIALDKTDAQTASKKESILYPETVNLAGKELLEYWLEWALHKKYTKLYIYTSRGTIENKKVQMLKDLYGIEIIYLSLAKLDDVPKQQKIYMGMGIFLDSGEYKVFQNIGELFMFEQSLIVHPITYSSLIGYGDTNDIQIGKNVYIHKSVKLNASVIIGDNCVIEKDVEICNSVICPNSFIKSGSIIQNSHIAKDVHMLTSLYLKGKALFKSRIYTLTSNKGTLHRGICK